jgi:hypothetical protein
LTAPHMAERAVLIVPERSWAACLDVASSLDHSR